MSGTVDTRGIYARSIGLLFQCLDEAQDTATVEIAMMEIYCNQLRDLLAADSRQRLEVSGLGAGQLANFQERVPGLSWERISGEDNALVCFLSIKCRLFWLGSSPLNVRNDVDLLWPVPGPSRSKSWQRLKGNGLGASQPANFQERVRGLSWERITGR
jgi:hypothetical protein